MNKCGRYVTLRGKIAFARPISNYVFFQNGEKYEGEFEDNTIVGNGTYYWPEGRKYVGEMVAGNSHGKGVMLYPPEDPDFR